MQVKRVDMRQCQFVYQDGRQSNHIGGSRCKKEAKYRAGMLCQLHRRRKTGVNGIGLEGGKQDHSFPRLFTHEEERRWVDEARKRTSPAENMRATCVVCGRLTEHQDVVIVTEFELLSRGASCCEPAGYDQIVITMWQTQNSCMGWGVLD